MTRLKTVIHVHTNYSYDANASPADVLEAARRQGVDVVAITDHDSIAGALEARELTEREPRAASTAGTEPGRCVRVIVGEEISSSDGHILGLFLRERIPPRLSAEATIRRIKAQGGLALAAHPGAILCEASLSYEVMERVAPLLDGVEVCNAQNPLLWEDRRAGRFAREHGLAAFVGADAHIRGHLDGGYQLLAEFADPTSDGGAAEGFKVSLQQAELHPGRHSASYFAFAGLFHYWGRVSRYPLLGLGANFYRSRPPAAVRSVAPPRAM